MANMKLFSELSDGGLLDLYKAIERALADDDSKDDPSQRQFMVRDTKDWMDWSKAIEVELGKRDISFERIRW